MAKKALLVGVNKYKYVRPLNGCVNDVRNMADILTSFYGFSANEIRTIVDESVTRNNLMNRFDWLLDDVKEGSSTAIHNMLLEYEGKKIKEGFKRVEHNLGFVEGITTADPFSDWGGIKDIIKDKKRALLFIHGTGSSIEGGYTDVPQKILEVLKNKYPLILGYDHFTLSKTPEDNAKDMLATLKNTGLLDTGLKFDIVTHSRGGLVLRSFVELCSGYLNVDNAVMVACPAGGAPLKIFFNLVGGLIKFASSKLKKPKAMPGVWAMNPKSEFIDKLNKNVSGIGSGVVTYNTIGSDFEPSGIFRGGIKDDIADSIADVYFGDPNDMVVDTDRMLVPWPRGINSGINFKYEPAEHVYHLNYFKQAETYRKFSDIFKVDLGTVIQECISLNQLNDKQA